MLSHLQRYNIGHIYACPTQSQDVRIGVCYEITSIIGNIQLWLLIIIVATDMDYFVFPLKITTH